MTRTLSLLAVAVLTATAAGAASLPASRVAFDEKGGVSLHGKAMSRTGSATLSSVGAAQSSTHLAARDDAGVSGSLATQADTKSTSSAIAAPAVAAAAALTAYEGAHRADPLPSGALAGSSVRYGSATTGTVSSAVMSPTIEGGSTATGVSVGVTADVKAGARIGR